MDERLFDQLLAGSLTEALGINNIEELAQILEQSSHQPNSGDTPSNQPGEVELEDDEVDGDEVNGVGNEASVEIDPNVGLERESNLQALQRIIRNGKYYYPATSHYPNATEVFCDSCNRGKLRAAIGWDSQDLCLSCAARVEMTIFYNGLSL